MSVRSWSIRSRLIALIAVPITCLVVFWGFATYLTLGDGLRLYHQGTLINEVAVPVENILNAMQDERRASMVYLAAPTAHNHDILVSARKTVDKKIAEYRTDLAKSSVRSVATDRILGLAHDELTKLGGLPKLRSRVDHRQISAPELMSSITDMLDGVTLLYSQVTSFPDDATAAEGRSLQSLAHARELRSREDAIMAGALAAGRFTKVSYRMFVQAVGIQRFEYHETYVAFTDQDKREYRKFFAKAPFPEIRAMEKAALDQGKPGKSVPVNAAQWTQDNKEALAKLYNFELHLADYLIEHTKPPSYTIFARLGITALFGLIVVLACILFVRRISNTLIRQLRGLRDSARDLAWVRLPSVVQRLGAGQLVDVDAEVPTLPAGRHEIGQVSEAFNEVGRTAVRAATEQAELRSGASNMFVNIARRSQTLLNRQISQLDVMERKAAEPETLDDLFRIDHLATRMRRNAENLVILGGGQPGRQWRKPVPLLDVLRSATSEVEQYERVRVMPFPEVMLAGSVVSDVAHLTAELIDNATTFSPPHTRVNVTGQSVPKGFAVEIEDRGLGMSPDAMESANEWLSTPPEFDVLALSDNARLGMFVVARIAARHGIKVRLRDSPYGGTTAIVLLPAELVAESGAADELARQDADRMRTSGPESSGREQHADEPVRAPVLVSTGAPVRAEGNVGRLRLAALPGAPDRPVPDAASRTRPVPAAAPREPDAPPRPSPGSGTPLRTPPPLPERSRRGTSRPTTGQRPAPVPVPALEPPVPEPPSLSPAPAAERAPEPRPSRSGDGDTHMGLPRRVRQANLAPGLRAGPPTSPQPDTPPAPQRSPEEIRRMMSSYQRGTTRGRVPESQRDGAGTGADPTPDTPPPHAPTDLTAAEVGREDG